MNWPPQDTGLFEFKIPCCKCPEFTLWAWGDNDRGQLGQGGTTDQTSPTQTGTDIDWFSCSAGGLDIASGSFSLGTKTDGTLWSWGDNTNGQLGYGTTGGTHYSPAQVGSDNTWSQISAGGTFSLGIKSNGTLWAWGLNNLGQLGLGDTTTRTSPTQVGTDTNWATCSAGGAFAVAIKSNGTIWSWGDNSVGQLGLGSAGGTHLSPAQIGSGTDWRSVSASSGFAGNFVLAIKSGGTIWSWGDNSFGELGLGTTGGTHYSPAQIGSDTDWSACSAGGANDGEIGTLYSTGIKAGGELWSWGNNDFGQLGLGNTTQYNSPQRVGSDTNWAFCVTGVYSTYGGKSNGVLYSWGNNDFGQLGFGTTGGTHTSPAQVGTETTWIVATGGGNYAMAIRS